MYRYPFTPYPNSWFRVARTPEVAHGRIVPVRYLGQDLILFRGDDGVVRCTGATCPHLGANLAAGGCVVGNTIQCPFHGWRFSGDGSCVAIPYSDRVPAAARLQSWPVREVNRLIFVYHHAQAAPPAFELPIVEEHGSDGWSRDHTLRWRIRMHVQEIAENAVDYGHFDQVHAYREYPSDTALLVEEQRFRVSMSADRSVLGKVGPTRIEIAYHGMGCAVARVWSKPAQLIALLTPTPIDDEHLEVQLTVMFKKTGNPIRDAVISSFLPRDIRRDFARDIPIWENKAYLPRPMLCRHDGPIMKVRHWAKQFYTAPHRDQTGDRRHTPWKSDQR
jgi:nitrite reductase/ring-hydroxylating ferredoxin subunit